MTMTTMNRHYGIVKWIFSGDTIVIKSLDRSSASPANDVEERLSLNYIKAPKLACPTSETDSSKSSRDEPYAFECREYLRKKLVNQEISYTIDFHIPKSNRMVCSVYLNNSSTARENIVESLLAEGLVELRQQVGARVNDPYYQRLVAINQKAEAGKRGRYSNESPDKHIRQVKWILNNPKQFLNEHRSASPLDAIVEFIRDGTTIRCLLLPTYQLATIQIAGITCPMLTNVQNVSSKQDEPSVNEAKRWVEQRLLQQQVKIILHDVNHQNLVGTVLAPGGNVAVCLLREGLARCIHWGLNLLHPDTKERYRSAEKFAIDKRIGIWLNKKCRAVPSNQGISMMDVSESSLNPSLKRYQVRISYERCQSNVLMPY
jgi:staphylococcal nuclease domain-containing protein 1